MYEIKEGRQRKLLKRKVRIVFFLLFFSEFWTSKKVSARDLELLIVCEFGSSKVQWNCMPRTWPLSNLHFNACFRDCYKYGLN